MTTPPSDFPLIDALDGLVRVRLDTARDELQTFYARGEHAGLTARERVEAGERALAEIREANTGLARLLEQAELAVRHDRNLMLDEDPAICDMRQPACPVHGANLIADHTGTRCRFPGCDRADDLTSEDWHHCRQPAVAVITDADGEDELRVCQGHLVDARASLIGMRIVRLVKGGGA